MISWLGFWDSLGILRGTKHQSLHCYRETAEIRDSLGKTVW